MNKNRIIENKKKLKEIRRIEGEIDKKTHA